MLNEKAREELTSRDATIMEDILAKGKFGITPAERGMLVARRGYLTEDALEQFSIDGPEVIEEDVNVGEGAPAAPVSAYTGKKFAELKKEAQERGITLEKTAKLVDIVALLEQFDNLKDGDEFQGQIAKITTQEMIDENELEEVNVGDLVFVDKE
jgi:hypothetical protein